MKSEETIKIEAVIEAGIQRVWELFTSSEHIVKWSFASDDWHSTHAENDLRVDGRFKTRMEAKDGSVGFDFGGIYTAVIPFEKIDYTLDDGRKVSVRFLKQGENTKVVEEFEPEATHSMEMQRGGWQSILDQFKLYVEANG